jgi:hypothetical protein
MWLSGLWGWGEADAGEWQVLYRVEGARRALKAARDAQQVAEVMRARQVAEANARLRREEEWRAYWGRLERLRTRNRTRNSLWTPGSRNYQIWAMYRAGGRTLADVGREFGLSGSRASGIVQVQQAVEDSRVALSAEKWRRAGSRQDLGRPVDMGGPRDVWLTYLPAADPRLDNMVPVTWKDV